MPTAGSFFRLLVPLLLSAQAWTQSPIGELFPSEPGAPQSTQLAGTGMTVVSGSQLSAGAWTATLKLNRGGQVLICPRSRLTVNSDTHGLMLGMDAGNIEVDFRSEQGVTDMAYTPDFSVLLAGPGTYHFAIGVAGNGDTCMKPLPGNSSGVVFSELMGSEVYGLAADESALFRSGKLNARASLTGDCGCPAPLPVMLAQTNATRPPEAPAVPLATSPTPGLEAKEDAAKPAPGAGTPPHITVDTPFVFSANSSAPVAKVDYSALPNTLLPQEEPDPVVLSNRAAGPTVQEAAAQPSPTPPPKKEKKKGFMAHLKGFFGGLFGR